MNRSQANLAECSGVCYGTLKNFERTGTISLISLLKLAMALGALEEFSTLFPEENHEKALSLDVLMHSKKRQRGHQ